MALLISKNNFLGSKNIGAYFVNTHKFKLYEENYLFHLSGEIFSHTIEEVINLIIDNAEVKFDKIIGDFSIILFNKKSNKLSILNDRAGRNLIYYSTKKDFSVSDDFWSIVKHDEYTVDDVDLLTFKTQIFFSASPDNKTILCGLNIVPNAVIADYINNSFSIKKYWHFNLKKNKLTKEQKYDEIDRLLSASFKTIKELNPENTVYGIGVSGGLDSRIIPHYALKYGMKLKSFIVGQEKPHRFWKSNDHISSDSIVDHFKLEHQKLEYNELSYLDKLELEVLYAPSVASQMFKIPNIDKIDFDVLLTGASGFYVGSSPFYSKIRKLDLIEMVCVQQTDLNLKRKFYRIKKGLNYIFGKWFNTNPVVVKSIEGIINESDVIQIHNKIKKYFSEMKNLNKTEKLMNYAVSILGQRNKSGSFESLLNHKKDYTPYMPFLMDAVEYWNEDDIYDRKLFENFIKERLPELASIKAQDYKTALDVDNPNLINKLLSLAMFVIRGTGVMNYPRWSKGKEFKKFVNEYFIMDVYVSSYFDIEKIKKLTYQDKIDSSVITGIIKLNEIIKRIDKNGIHNHK